MKIAQVAAKSALPVKTVRYYADIGLVKPVSRTASGYRWYDQHNLRQLIFIRRARAFGFSVEQCRELLALYSNDQRTSADVKKIAAKRLAEIERKQQELQILRDELTDMIHSCRGDDSRDCPIIESLAK